MPVFTNDEVIYNGQLIGIVLAKSGRQARQGAGKCVSFFRRVRLVHLRILYCFYTLLSVPTRLLCNLLQIFQHECFAHFVAHFRFLALIRVKVTYEKAAEPPILTIDEAMKRNSLLDHTTGKAKEGGYPVRMPSLVRSGCLCFWVYCAMSLSALSQVSYITHPEVLPVDVWHSRASALGLCNTCCIGTNDVCPIMCLFAACVYGLFVVRVLSLPVTSYSIKSQNRTCRELLMTALNTLC